MNEATSAPVEVYRTRRAKRAQDYALVLQAIGVECAVFEQQGEVVLAVRPHDQERASRELALYEAENRGWPRAEELPEVLTEGSLGVLLWCCVLMSVYALERNHAFGFAWWEDGANTARLVREGEWWRVLTALTLHADIVHLTSNLVFGSLFVGVLCQLLGTGLALHAIVLAGALGNYANDWIQGPDFGSIGASTAVFGALGILGGNRWARRRAKRRVASWIPLLASALLLGFLGTGARPGEHIDVVGHICGFLAGVPIGVLHSRFGRERHREPRWQFVFGGSALLAWALAWQLALT